MYKLPPIGLGVWNMAEGKETEQAVAFALEVGYRLVDTAKLYGNESSVGRAVQGSRVPRADINVTTKLWPTDFLRPEAAFEESLEKLGLEYIDLYLIHWPIPLMPKSVWQKLEKIQESGRAKAIGVSNYSINQLEKLLSYAKVVPAVNQIECHIKEYDPALIAYCREKGIVVEAYSPLGRGSLINEPKVIELAQKYSKTSAQILLQWCVEVGTVPLPKSSNKLRIIENAQIFNFELSPADTSYLTS